MKVGDCELRWLGHSGFFIKSFKNIYIDPYNISDLCEEADLILITHSHQDHCSYDDLRKIVREGTVVVMTVDCQSKVARINIPLDMQIIESGEEIEIFGIKITAFPAYNKDKSFHNKENGWVGYVLRIGEDVFYHAGDTDFISEMEKLTGYNGLIAMLPVGGRFTMNAEEAAEAAKLIKPTLAIPMHYGTIVGDESDAREFVELCIENGIKAKILDKK